jgi:hypothetical protein
MTKKVDETDLAGNENSKPGSQRFRIIDPAMQNAPPPKTHSVTPTPCSQAPASR